MANDTIDMSWDDLVTPIAETIGYNWDANPQDADMTYTDPDGWIWRPDINGVLCCSYYSNNRLCIIWPRNDDGSFQWQHDGTNYNCRDVGIEGRSGIFDNDGNLVAIMQLNATLDVQWVDDSDDDE